MVAALTFRKFKPVYIITAILVAINLFLPAPLEARTFKNFEAIARRKFQEQKYDEAITYYRKHLRRHSRDYNAWNQMGAAYYHVGLPKRGLRYLKQVQRKTINRSYNYYYQGLCYIAIGNKRRTRQYLSYVASRYSDEYAARATFELGLFEYKNRDARKAAYWLNIYNQRYPNGVFRSQTQKMLQGLAYNTYYDDIEGSKKPDMEAALFKYNPLSLFDYPHFWFTQLGYRYKAETGKEPAPGGKLKDRQSDDHGVLANFGIGAGPIRDGNTTGFIGYTYRQLWITDADRFTEFSESFDFSYFPLRADLLERTHQIYGDFRYDIQKMFFLGVFGRYELGRIGSSFFPSPDPPDFQVSQTIANTLLAIPWIGISYLDNFRTLGYVYLRQEINQEAPEFNNKTFDLDSQVASFGLSHSMEFPEYDLNIGIELFQYTFVYNDYYLDYDRQGLLITAEHELIPRWYIQGLVGLYEDAYISRRPKTGSCKTVLADEGQAQANQNVIRNCARNDSGTLLQAGLYWNWTQFRRFSAYAQQVENINAKEKEYDEATISFWVTFTYAFPSVRRVQRFVDRFADSAFTKEPE